MPLTMEQLMMVLDDYNLMLSKVANNRKNVGKTPSLLLLDAINQVLADDVVKCEMLPKDAVELTTRLLIVGHKVIPHDDNALYMCLGCKTVFGYFYDLPTFCPACGKRLEFEKEV